MLLKLLLVWCAFLGLACAAEGLGKPPPKPDKFKNVEGCYIKSLDEVIPFGSTKHASKPCMRYSCSEQWIVFNSCGAVLNPRTQGKPDEPYLACCPR